MMIIGSSMSLPCEFSASQRGAVTARGSQGKGSAHSCPIAVSHFGGGCSPCSGVKRISRRGEVRLAPESIGQRSSESTGGSLASSAAASWTATPASPQKVASVRSDTGSDERRERWWRRNRLA